MTGVEQVAEVKEQLGRLLDKQRLVEAAVVVTTDGLLYAGLGRSPRFDKDTMDGFAAGVASMCAAGRGAATVASGGATEAEQGVTAHQVLISNLSGWIVVVPAGQTAWLALYAPECQDVGLLSSAAGNFAGQVGAALSPAARVGTETGAAPLSGS